MHLELFLCLAFCSTEPQVCFCLFWGFFLANNLLFITWQYCSIPTWYYENNAILLQYQNYHNFKSVIVILSALLLLLGIAFFFFFNVLDLFWLQMKFRVILSISVMHAIHQYFISLDAIVKCVLCLISFLVYYWCTGVLLIFQTCHYTSYTTVCLLNLGVF